MENWGLLGHDWAVDMLRQHISRDQVRHAYLFCGPPGLGRRTLALRFAKALNCPTPITPGEPCNKCKTCQQIEKMQYADLAILQAEKDGVARVGGILKVEQVRTMRQSLVLKPYQGRYRVVIFLRFQEANPSASNALLKTLEEAPAHAVLLLTADTPEGLLPTIVSRCEVLRLRPLPVEKVENYLQEQGAGTSTHLLAHISGGRPGYALRLLQDPQALEARQVHLQDVHDLLKMNRRGRFTYAEKLAKDKDTLRDVLLLWLAYWRDVLLCVSGAGSQMVNVDHRAEIEDLASKLSLPAATGMVNRLEDAIGQLEDNVNARLLTEVLLLDFPNTGG